MNKKVTISLLLFYFLVFSTATAQNRKQIQVYSQKMQQEIPCNIILPDHYNQDNSVRYPVIYLLHGYSGNTNSWPETAPQLSQWASEFGVIFVSPEGKNSWYFDSPLRSDLQYETFVAKELISSIDRQFRTIALREARAITGLSMGGHGAMWLAINHKDIFGAAGSTSGGVDFTPFEQSWEIKESLGEMKDFPQRWKEHTVNHAIESLKEGDLAIIFDCGTNDFFLPVNRALHQKMIDLGISHDYIERPGGHEGAYWKNAIDYQILFFHKFFEKGKK